VSGDYYDVIEREDGRLWCLIADVTGRVAAALQMANLRRRPREHHRSG
jgi:serine phosphatase RsbU (regulator of sigma subunit)